MESIIEKFLEIAIILLAAKIGAELMRRISQPAVIGELIAGIVIGYYGLGLLPHAQSGDVISTLAEVGIILLLFEVGLETNLKEFIDLGKTSLLVALIGVIAPFFLGFGFVYLIDSSDYVFEKALFVGAAMTATSVGITARVFADLGALKTKEAKTIIGAAVVDDIFGLIILTVVAGMLGGTGNISGGEVGIIAAKALAFLLASVVIGRKLSPTIFKFFERVPSPGTFVTGSFLFAIVFGAAAHFVGLHPIVGAFAGGVVAGESDMTKRIREEMKPLNYILVPIFFVYTGSEVDISVLANGSIFLYGVVISLLAFIGKYMSALGALGKGMNTSLIGIGMVPRGEVGLIFVAVATSTFSEVIGPGIIAAIVWMVINTTLIAPILLSRILKKSSNNKPVEDERFESPVVDG
ncbi:MAG: cation:proton antiporter [Candidatus Actinomarinales bacterium]|nr:MAG: cation:proton antiporter [Candidatus Actinomarinales bacterium]|tara:strand:+ start:67 stop:1293 length:1227 start_codon:yes stop_codon:yes gene_type:complete